MPLSSGLTVTQLSQQLKSHIEGQFSNISLHGEISGYKKHSSGHHYLCLKDAHSMIDAICWKGTFLPFPLEDGLNVICIGRVTTYPLRSKYQFIIQSIQNQGTGSLLLILEERKKKLLAEGLFDPEHKKPLPAFVQRIGLITSPTGAVIQDILHRLRERWPVHVYLYPATVQGAQTVKDIVCGLQTFCQMDLPPDVIIIARGGGSIEDLWSFNEEAIVRAVFSCSIPVISAIGHETDTTLVDFVSDQRAPTPTAAAEFATPVRSHVREKILHLRQKIFQTLMQKIDQNKMGLNLFSQKLSRFIYSYDFYLQRLDELYERFERSWTVYFQCLNQKYVNHCGRLNIATLLRQITHHHQRISLVSLRIRSMCMNKLGSDHQRLDFLLLRLGRGPVEEIQSYQAQVLSVKNLLDQSIVRYLAGAASTLDHSVRLLSELSYEKTLSRGFVLASDRLGRPIQSVQNSALEKKFKLDFIDGSINVIQTP